jgi:hypothetical protein
MDMVPRCRIRVSEVWLQLYAARYFQKYRTFHVKCYIVLAKLIKIKGLILYVPVNSLLTNQNPIPFELRQVTKLHQSKFRVLIYLFDLDWPVVFEQANHGKRRHVRKTKAHSTFVCARSW